MTRVVLNPLELNRVSGVLRLCAEDADANEQRLRMAALPELPDGFGPIDDELRSAGTLLRNQSIDLRAQAADLTQRAERIVSDQASATARLFGPNACRPIPPHVSYWDGVEHRAGVLWNLAVGDDLKTIRDPQQPWWERGVAVLSLLPAGKALKGVRLADDAFKVERDATAATDVARAAQVAEKSRYTLAEWRLAAGSRGRAARELEANMRAASMGDKPAGYEVHHIVPAFDPRAEDAQRALARQGIRPNDAANGVYLPGPKLKEIEPRPAEAFHRPIHTNSYYKTLDRNLAQATTRQQAIGILAKARRGLVSAQAQGHLQ